jgi:hypothetical protein
MIPTKLLVEVCNENKIDLSDLILSQPSKLENDLRETIKPEIGLTYGGLTCTQRLTLYLQFLEVMISQLNTLECSACKKMKQKKLITHFRNSKSCYSWIKIEIFTKMETLATDFDSKTELKLMFPFFEKLFESLLK